MKVLLDTNVIVDALQNRMPWAADAQELFLRVATEDFIGCITAKSVTDIYYLMHRMLHDDGETRKRLGQLFSLFEVLDTCGIDCKKALASDTHDYEDAVMIETASRHGVDCIVTRNLSDYALSPMPIYDPAHFLDLYPPMNSQT